MSNKLLEMIESGAILELAKSVKDNDITLYFEFGRIGAFVTEFEQSEKIILTLDDMKILTTAVKDLNDRIEIRVRKSLVGDDDKAKKKIKTKAVKKAKPFPSVTPPTQTQPKTNQTALPTQTDAKVKALQQVDFNKMRDDLLAKQQALQPIKPIPTQ